MRAAATRTTPVRHWRIHLGAHKTATTHLQETLTAVRRELAARGVDFIPNQLVRSQKLAPHAVAAAADRAAADRRPGAHARGHRGDLEPLRIGPETVVLSEENIVGMPEQILAVPFYPQAALSVARLASLGLKADLVFFLSIRSYDTLLPSAYAEALKHAPPPPGGFEPDQGAAAGRAAELVRPRLADPRRGAGRALADSGGRRTTAPMRGRSWRRSAAARSARCRSSPTRPGPARRPPRRSPRSRRCRRICRGRSGWRGCGRSTPPAPPGEDRFRPFDQAERRRLRADYEADLGRIAQVFPDVLMRFAPKELAA